MTTHTLIINADDLGYTTGITQGIVQAFQQGVLTSSSAMINIPGAPERVAWARAQAPDLPIGLHLNITAGRPVLPPERVPSLVDGRGCFYPMLALIARLGQVRFDELRAELAAQAALLHAAGIRFDHIDYHQMLLSLYAPFYPLVIELASQYRVPVRQPAIKRFHTVKLPGSGGASTEAIKGLLSAFRQSPLQMLKVMPQLSPQAANRQLQRLAEAGVATTDWFIPAFFNNATLDNFLTILRSLPPGLSELMCHPGLVDDELLASGDEYTHPRQSELSILTNPRVRQVVEEQKIRLASFAAVRRG